MGNFFQQGPSIQELETKFFQSVGDLPPDKQTYSNITNIASQHGLPNPPKAAEYWLKQYDAHKRRIKEDLPDPSKQPTGSVPLDIPLAKRIASQFPDLNYLAPAMQQPLGGYDGRAATIQDVLPLLPENYDIPGPVQFQKELSFFAPPALEGLPQTITQPYVASNIVDRVMQRPPGFQLQSYEQGQEKITGIFDPETGILTRLATAPRELPPTKGGITQIPIGEENVTYYTDPVTGMPTELLATAPRELPSAKASQDRAQATELRKEFTAHPVTKDYTIISNQYEKMNTAFDEAKRTNNFIAVDQALITMYNKMLDPTSVVRESEYARTPENISLLSRAKGYLEKLKEGGAGVTMEDRAALVKLANEFYKVSEQKYRDTEKYYREVSKQYGIDPKLVIQEQKTLPGFGWTPQKEDRLKELEKKKGSP